MITINDRLFQGFFINILSCYVFIAEVKTGRFVTRPIAVTIKNSYMEIPLKVVFEQFLKITVSWVVVQLQKSITAKFHFLFCMQPCLRPTQVYGTHYLEKNIIHKLALNYFELEKFWFCNSVKMTFTPYIFKRPLEHV